MEVNDLYNHCFTNVILFFFFFFETTATITKNKGKITARREKNVDVIILQGAVENTAIFFPHPLKEYPS